jgi:frataxin
MKRLALQYAPVARLHVKRSCLFSSERVIQRQTVPVSRSMLGKEQSRFFSSSDIQAAAGSSTVEFSEGEFDHVADSLLESLENTLDRLSVQLNPEEITCAYGVLTLDFGKRGVWVLNKQSPNRQIWWSSPISGPRRFEYSREKKQWVWTRDHSVSLHSLLSSEISSFSGSKVVFDA